MVRTLICISRLIEISCHDGETVHFTDDWFSLYVVETDVRGQNCNLHKQAH